MLFTTTPRRFIPTHEGGAPIVPRSPLAASHSPLWPESCTAFGMGKARVLIVEDDSDVRRLYAIGLNQRGYEVKLAANGAEAVVRIESERPDVILLDWLMPLMDGKEVLDRLSRERGVPAIPIIVISGQPAPTGAALDPRIRCWLTKPVTIDELVAQIQQPLQDVASELR